MKVKSDDITNFFNNIKVMLNPSTASSNSKNNIKLNFKTPDMIDPSKKLKKDQTDKEGTQRTNVIYLNTDCNLRCEYCYEKDSRDGLPDKIKLTPKEIDTFLLEICKREKTKASTIVLMGGEPFLNFDLIEYTILKACSMVKEKGSGWGISLISNGTLFTDKILSRYKEIIDIASKNNISISQEVSYDGSGQYRRKWPNGSSSKDHVEKGIQKLIDFKIPFKISYTTHIGNYKNLLKDIIYILEKYPKQYNYRITVGYAHSDLEKALGPNASFKIKEDFKPYANHLLDLYGVPICGNTCEYCNQCNRTSYVGNSYLSPTTGISYDEKTTDHDFQQW